MSNPRKLQSEIDRVLKKVYEGVQTFDDIWEKVYSAQNANQKEKFEADLKKEIKKLQRYREQIKGWIAGNEIKDKRALMEARKAVENEMERFKVCEKETKTKAYSKEGLAQAPKADPLEEKKDACRDWIRGALQDLADQVDGFEAEIEGMESGVRRGKKSELAEKKVSLEGHIADHREHERKLEMILRLLDNDEVDVDAVDSIREDVEYYVESNQEPDFFNDESIYAELDLDSVIVEDVAALARKPADQNDEEAAPSSPSPSASSGGDGEGKVAKSPDSHPFGRLPPKQPPSPAAAPARSKVAPPSPASSVGGLPPRPRTSPNVQPSASPHAHPAKLPAAKKVEAPSYAAAAAAPSVHQPSDVKGGAGAVSKGLPSPAFPPSPAPQQPQQPQQPQPQRSPLQSAPAQSPSQQSQPPQLRHIQMQQQQQQQQQQGRSAQQQQQPQPQQAQPASPRAPQQAQPQLPPSSQPSAAQSPQPQASPQLHSPQQQAPPQMQATAQSQMAPQMQQSPQPQQMAMPPRSPSTPVSAAFPSQAPGGPVAQDQPQPKMGPLSLVGMHQLALSHLCLPDHVDVNRPRHYQPHNPVSTPQSFPQEIPRVFDNPALFEKFDVDTLYFSFYCQQGTYQQYLAARELKKQSWRFHKKELKWFQRHEEPKECTDEYEMGAYIYFDWENNWCTRVRREFKFDYKFLEDELVV